MTDHQAAQLLSAAHAALDVLERLCMCRCEASRAVMYELVRDAAGPLLAAVIQATREPRREEQQALDI